MKEFQFQNWIAVLEENAAKRDSISWNENYRLNPHELKCICSSVQQFQRGESGEGKFIFQDAKQFVKNCSDDS